MDRDGGSRLALDRSADSVPAWRSSCLSCNKPVAFCVCGTITPVANRTRVLILQHPRERFHALGTVRFAKLALQQVEVALASPREIHADPSGLFRGGIGARPGLLYPSPRARAIEELAPSERPDTLIVLDGTWPQSRALRRANPWLDALEHLSIRPTAPSRYRIRAEPDDRSVATIEAIVQALRALEPDTPDLDRLLEAFDRMIDRQIAASAVRQGRLRLPKVRSISRAVPELLASAADRVVLAHVETVPTADGGQALVHVVALRMVGGAPFELVLRPPDLASAKLPHLGLDRAGLEAAPGPDVLGDEWPAFFREDDIFTCWGTRTLEILSQVIDRPKRHIDLKKSYCNLRRGAAGALDDVLRREGLAPEPLPFAGRAGRVMGNLRPVARLLANAATSK